MSRFNNTNLFVTGRTTVTVAGTPVQTATNEIPPGISVVVKSLNTNTGVMTVGNSSTNSLASGTVSFRLQPGESIELQCSNTSRIWVDATVSGEAIEFIFEQ